MNTAEQTRGSFFTHDPAFFRALFPLLCLTALQNLVAYSVNMIDNLMLGGYQQAALSGAAVVNQLFFLIQQLALSIGDSLVVLAAQYWGQKRAEPVRVLTHIALRLALVCGVAAVGIGTLFPHPLLRLFTSDPDILAAGQSYLSILQFSFPLFMVSQVLLAALRGVQTVKIAFYVSLLSLGINFIGNYAFIFGHFGCPELGVRGAALSTLIARAAELLVILAYLRGKDRKLRLFSRTSRASSALLRQDLFRTARPIILSSLLWAVSVPLQTAVLGHLSADAIAANSVSTTFYQYLKVVVVAMSSASAVMIGISIGRGDRARVRSDARTLSAIDLSIGLLLALILFISRGPLLELYRLSPTALRLADQFMRVMCLVMVGMSYQMPVSSGIIRGSGDADFVLRMNLISVWFIVLPLSLLSAFRWGWPPAAVVLMLQSDQLFKCVPVFLRLRSGKWIRQLTRGSL